MFAPRGAAGRHKVAPTPCGMFVQRNAPNGSVSSVKSFRFANEKNKRLSAYLCKKVNQRREVNYCAI